MWLVALLLTLGIAYAVAALAVYVPDLAQAVPVGVTILFWLTPILYPASLVENHGALWMRNIIMDYNPFYYLVDLSRHAVFGGARAWPGTRWRHGAGGGGYAGVGPAVFRKLQPGFADVI